MLWLEEMRCYEWCSSESFFSRIHSNYIEHTYLEATLWEKSYLLFLFALFNANHLKSFIAFDFPSVI